MTMAIAASIAVALVALLHLYFLRLVQALPGIIALALVFLS